MKRPMKRLSPKGSMKRKRIVILLALLAGAIAVAVNATTHNPTRDKVNTAITSREVSSVSKTFARAQSEAAPDNSGLIRRGMLASQLHSALEAQGDRLQRPGKERLIVTGLLRHADDPQPNAFMLIRELPGRLRLEMHGAGGARVLISDGQSVTASDNRFDQRDRELLELLTYDSVEHFFSTQAAGAGGTRFLGARFRKDGDLANPPYDLVEVTETAALAGDAREQTRTYHFNSDTHLLERVSHSDFLSGMETTADVMWSDWRVVAGQQIAHRVERRQNDKTVLTITIQSAAVGPRVQDGLLGLSK